MTSMRDRWAAGEETLGFWLSVPGLMGAEIAARRRCLEVGDQLRFLEPRHRLSRGRVDPPDHQRRRNECRGGKTS